MDSLFFIFNMESRADLKEQTIAHFSLKHIPGFYWRPDLSNLVSLCSALILLVSLYCYKALIFQI